MWSRSYFELHSMTSHTAPQIEGQVSKQWVQILGPEEVRSQFMCVWIVHKAKRTAEQRQLVFQIQPMQCCLAQEQLSNAHRWLTKSALNFHRWLTKSVNMHIYKWHFVLCCTTQPCYTLTLFGMRSKDDPFITPPDSTFPSTTVPMSCSAPQTHTSCDPQVTSHDTPSSNYYGQ